MSVLRRFLGETMIYGVTTIVSRLLYFLLTPIYISRLQQASSFGILTVLYSWVAMANAVLAFGMETTYFRYLQKVEPEDKGKVFSNSFFVTIVTSGLFLATVVLFSDSIASWFSQGVGTSDYEYYIRFFAVILVADALAVVPFARLRAEGKALRFALLKTVNISLQILLNLSFLYWLPALIEHHSFWQGLTSGWFRPDWILGNIFMANLIASVVTLLLLLPQILTVRIRPDAALIRSMIRYSFPILIGNISFIVNEYLDKMAFPWLLPGEQGVRDAGVYGAVSKIAVFLSFFVTAFRLGAEPFFFSQAKSQNAPRTYATVMEYFVIVMVVVMVGITANLDWLKHFIRTPDPEQQALYWSGLYIVPILLFNYVLLGIYMNLSIWYKLTDQTRYSIYISGLGAIVTIILIIILIPRYSYFGAAIATTIAYVVMVSLSYFWGQKNYRIPYPVLKITAYLVAAVLLSLTIFWLFDTNVWLSNALFLAFCLIVVVLEKRTIRRLLTVKS